jgi:urease gamma subunit
VVVWVVAEMARRRRTRGLKLNFPEAVALICDEVQERAREGGTLVEVQEYGYSILVADDVMDGVPELANLIQVEALFPDGSRLVTLRNPIR